MKKIFLLFILIIVLTICSFGQGGIRLWGLDSIRQEITLEDDYETLKLERRLIGLYSDYKKECYADSTKRIHPFLTSGLDSVECENYDTTGFASLHIAPSPCINGYIVFETLKEAYYYTHKIPSFEGFMEWIYKQYYLEE